MSDPTLLTESRPKARKHHRCHDCGGMIAPGMKYRKVNIANDGSAYTLKQHLDCAAMSAEVVANGYARDYWDGVPELTEMCEVMEDLNAWRGKYPHVVCRIEYLLQIQEIRWRDDLKSRGINPDTHE